RSFYNRCIVLASPGGLCMFGTGQATSTEKQWIVILDKSGQPSVNLKSTTPDVQSMSLSATEYALVVGDPNTARTVTTTNGDRLRIRGEATPDGNFVVVSGLSTDDVTKTLHQL